MAQLIEIEPFSHSRLAVGDSHEIYWEAAAIRWENPRSFCTADRVGMRSWHRRCSIRRGAPRQMCRCSDHRNCGRSTRCSALP
jgi:hypothetical protein